MTKAGKETWLFIVDFYRKKKYYPRLKDIAERFNLTSINSAAQRVYRLERQGWVIRDGDLSQRKFRPIGDATE